MVDCTAGSGIYPNRLMADKRDDNITPLRLRVFV